MRAVDLVPPALTFTSGVGNESFTNCGMHDKSKVGFAVLASCAASIIDRTRMRDKRRRFRMSISTSLDRYFSRERGRYGIWVVSRRAATRTSAALHGRMLGWERASVPVSSNIVGTKHISVMPGFFASGAVWVEAISSYGSDSFLP